MAGPSRGVDVVDLTQGSNSDEGEEEDDLEFYGQFRTKVVGVRYYTGVVNMREMVVLVREPDNPYDRNAIRVDNVVGDKVGHISREEAAALAPLVDSGQLALEAEACGPKGVYQLPIFMYCYGPPGGKQAVFSRLSAAGVYLDGGGPGSGSLASQGTGRGAGGGGGGGSGGGAGAGGGPRMASAQVESSLQRMWEELGFAAEGQWMLDPATNTLISGLFPHQKAALAWMVGRENSSGLPPFWEESGGSYLNVLTRFQRTARPAPLRGGVLADDMGLGKTLTVLALISTNRPGVSASTLVPYKGSLATGAVMGAGGAGTSASGAGVGDDDDDEGPAKKKRKKGEKQTSKQAAKAKGAKPKGQQTEAAVPAALEGPFQPPAAGGPRATLVVCPLSVLSNWQTQVEEHVMPGLMQVYVYHGPNRNSSPKFLAGNDIVLTTYATLASDFKGNARAGLRGVHWLRVVLDEAHVIKNPKSQQAKAAAALNAERRWAISGTPIQNSLKDIHGLACFLRLDPLSDRSLFTRTIERPVKLREARGVKQLQVLMGAIALRREKTMLVGGRPLVELPPRTVSVTKVTLGADDRAKYNRLEAAVSNLVSGLLADNALLTEYSMVLEFILRLRQVCDAGCLCPEHAVAAAEALAVVPRAAPARGGRAQDPVAALSAEMRAKLMGHLQAAADEECPICLSQMEAPCITTCDHVFCKECILEVLQRDKPSCPLCRAHLSPAHLLDPPPSDAPSVPSQGDAAGTAGAAAAAAAPAAMSSAKIVALLQRLRANRDTDAATAAAARALNAAAQLPPPTKAVVFSQFTGMLDLIQAALVAEGLPWVRLDGSSSAKARMEAIASFSSRAQDSPTVFLISLRAGGTGLNLTAACQVHLMDPWWNPLVEDQAADRVHRLGQTRAVEVVRYVASDSIEERMLQLQERKRELATVAFARATQTRQGAAASDTRQMRIDDVRLLMRIA